MEEHVSQRNGGTVASGGSAPVPWRDLREWLALIDRKGLLKRIDKPVDPDEELAAITFMATRREDAPALLFDNLAGDRSGSPLLINMLGSSRERYALAVGLDPGLPLAELIAATRTIMQRRIKPAHVPKGEARVNEVVLLDNEIDLMQFPTPKFWPGDGGRYIGTGNITLTCNPDTGRINVGCYRQMLHGPRRVGLYCSPGKHGGLDRDAWWARGKPCEGVAGYGIDPGLLRGGRRWLASGGAGPVGAGGWRGGPVEPTGAGCGGLPIPANAEFVIEGVLHPGEVEEEGPLGEFTGYYGRERGPQPVI